jgi:hypothetical protein
MNATCLKVAPAPGTSRPPTPDAAEQCGKYRRISTENTDPDAARLTPATDVH